MRGEQPSLKSVACSTAHLVTCFHVGARGFEPRTSALSELRSNQLSYAPETNR